MGEMFVVMVLLKVRCELIGSVLCVEVKCYMTRSVDGCEYDFYVLLMDNFFCVSIYMFRKII